jgi:hypothetical protein
MRAQATLMARSLHRLTTATNGLRGGAIADEEGGGEITYGLHLWWNLHLNPLPLTSF